MLALTFMDLRFHYRRTSAGASLHPKEFPTMYSKRKPGELSIPRSIYAST